MDPQVQAVLDQIGRQGWSLISKVPAPDSTPTTDRFGAPVPAKNPEGSEQWTITDGKGHNQTLVVKPPSAYPGPYSADVNDPGAYQPNYQVVDPPKDLPAPQATPGYTDVKGIKNADGSTSYYGRNPSTGQFEQIKGLPNEPAAADTKRSNPDEDVLTAIKRQAAEAERNERERNAASGAGYMTNSEADALKARWAQLGLSQQQQNLERQKFEDSQRRQDQTESRLQSESRANIGRTTAETGRIGAETNLTQAQIDALRAKTPQEIANLVSTGQLTQAQAEQIRTATAIAQAPQPVATSADQPYIVQRDPTTGQTSQVPNPNYQPQNPAQIVSQLQQKAQAERDRLADLPLPDEQKRAQFDTWWQQNIQPQADQLQRLQAQKDYENQRLAYVDQTTAANNEATYEQRRQETALGAGKQAVADVNATLPYRVGPGFGEDFSKALGTLSSGGGAVSFDPTDFTYDMPNTDQIAEQATNRALAHISPYAAYKTGAPPPQIPQGIDYGAALNSSRYQFGGGQAAPTTTISPDGTVTIEHAPPQQPAPPAAAGPQLPDFGAASINDPARGPGVPAPQQAPDWYTAWQARQAADAAQQQSAAALPIPDYVPQ